ncbi:MAG: hypothetical protein COA42_18290 [Alteromonadaceae bacterium]|nr:MAG: hypothetical protein COA42_18290 [Alteromonadaceae bacterium]
MSTKHIVEYIDRETDERCREQIYGERELDFLYHSRLGRCLRPLLLGYSFSALNGLPKRLARSRARIAEFAERYQLAVDEAEFPLSDYASLDAFFCRRLKACARPWCQDGQALCSPADGRVLAYRIDKQCRLAIKGQNVSVAQLLNGKINTATTLASEALSALHGGQALVVRLAPKDYHRFHFPTAGTVADLGRCPGPLESVHPIALCAGAPSFLNKRRVVCLHSEVFGPVYLVAVGALTIGTIVHSFTPGAIERGQEWGYFRFGGSTVVMLWGPQGPNIDADIWRNSHNELETLVKCGTQIAHQHTQ